MKANGFTRIPALPRRLVAPLTACLAGYVGAWLLWPLDTQALDALQLEVAQLEAQTATQTQTQGQTQGRKPHPEPYEDESLPDLAEAAALWPWLQQRLRAQGLQVQQLRPQGVTGTRALPEQGVALRLQGRWQDWLAFEADWHRHAPWWVIDQWQVVPVGLSSEAVRIDLQARLGFRPPVFKAQGATPRVWPEWPVLADREPMPGHDLFAPVKTPLAHALAGQVTPLLPADPRDPSAPAWRLLGVWQQAGTAHAVLDLGEHPIVVQQGQRVGRGAYRVHRIGLDQVELAVAGPSGPVLRLTLQKEKP